MERRILLLLLMLLLYHYRFAGGEALRDLAAEQCSASRLSLLSLPARAVAAMRSSSAAADVFHGAARRIRCR